MGIEVFQQAFKLRSQLGGFKRQPLFFFLWLGDVLEKHMLLKHIRVVACMNGDITLQNGFFELI